MIVSIVVYFHNRATQYELFFDRTGSFVWSWPIANAEIAFLSQVQTRSGGWCSIVSHLGTQELSMSHM